MGVMCWAGGAGADAKLSEDWTLRQWGQEVRPACSRSLIGRERERRGSYLKKQG